jgi:hypothetical protein
VIVRLQSSNRSLPHQHQDLHQLTYLYLVEDRETNLSSGVLDLWPRWLARGGAGQYPTRGGGGHYLAGGGRGSHVKGCLAAGDPPQGIRGVGPV